MAASSGVFNLAAMAGGVGAPFGLIASVVATNVTLNWTSPGGEPVTSHVIEAGSAAGLSDLAVFDTGSALPSLFVTGVPAGTYFVRVRARQGGLLTSASNEVMVIVGPVSTRFTIELPIRLTDSQNDAYGLLPFGVHIGDHGIDGHPGWDLEFVPGANVYAAASGTIQSLLPSGNGTGFGIQIQHQFGSMAYRTIYGVAAPAAGIAPGASVSTGTVLGAADVFTRTIGQTTVTYGMMHFQVDDFSSRSGLTNQHAVPPERFLSAAARTVADAIWRTAAYSQELIEPFIANPRDVAFPMTRMWTLASGTLAPRIDITAASASSNGYTYAFRDASGTILETGTLEINAIAKPLSTLDFRPAGSSLVRRGVYAIVDGVMQLDYGAVGAPRSTAPTAATYRTQ